MKSIKSMVAECPVGMRFFLVGEGMLLLGYDTKPAGENLTGIYNGFGEKMLIVATDALKELTKEQVLEKFGGDGITSITAFEPEGNKNN